MWQVLTLYPIFSAHKRDVIKSLECGHGSGSGYWTNKYIYVFSSYPCDTWISYFIYIKAYKSNKRGKNNFFGWWKNVKQAKIYEEIETAITKKWWTRQDNLNEPGTTKSDINDDETSWVWWLDSWNTITTRKDNIIKEYLGTQQNFVTQGKKENQFFKQYWNKK